jgi:hypothetical protein
MRQIKDELSFYAFMFVEQFIYQNFRKVKRKDAPGETVRL